MGIVLAILGSVLITLKVLGYIALSWWLVLLPFYFGVAAAAVIILFTLLGFGGLVFGSYFKEKSRFNRQRRNFR